MNEDRYTSCLLHGIVMQNRFGQHFLLVPNYKLCRVEVLFFLSFLSDL